MNISFNSQPPKQRGRCELLLDRRGGNRGSERSSDFVPHAHPAPGLAPHHLGGCFSLVLAHFSLQATSSLHLPSFPCCPHPLPNSRFPDLAQALSLSWGKSVVLPWPSGLLTLPTQSLLSREACPGGVEVTLAWRVRTQSLLLSWPPGTDGSSPWALVAPSGQMRKLMF